MRFFATLGCVKQYVEDFHQSRTKGHIINTATNIENALVPYLEQLAGHATQSELFFIANHVPVHEALATLQGIRNASLSLTIADIRDIVHAQKQYLEQHGHTVHAYRIIQAIEFLSFYYGSQQLENIARTADLDQARQTVPSHFTHEERTTLVKAGAIPELLNTCEQPLSCTDIQLARRLGRTDVAVNWIQNSSLPKALVLVADEGTGAFAPQRFVRDVRELQDGYNVQVRYINNEHTFWNTLQKVLAKATVHLLMISGHGAASGISLHNDSDCDLSLNSDRMKVIRHLACLPGGSVIVLDSCKTGRGTQMGDNFANFIARYAPQSKIIAAHGACSKMKVFRHTPLDLRFYNYIGPVPQDVTYVIEPVSTV